MCVYLCVGLGPCVHLTVYMGSCLSMPMRLCVHAGVHVSCVCVCVVCVSVLGELLCLYEVCVCMDMHCVLGIKCFTFMRVRVSVHCGQFTC